MGVFAVTLANLLRRLSASQCSARAHYPQGSPRARRAQMEGELCEPLHGCASEDALEASPSLALQVNPGHSGTFVFIRGWAGYSLDDSLVAPKFFALAPVDETLSAFSSCCSS